MDLEPKKTIRRGSSRADATSTVSPKKRIPLAAGVDTSRMKRDMDADDRMGAYAGGMEAADRFKRNDFDPQSSSSYGAARKGIEGEKRSRADSLEVARHGGLTDPDYGRDALARAGITDAEADDAFIDAFVRRAKAHRGD